MKYARGLLLTFSTLLLGLTIAACGRSGQAENLTPETLEDVLSIALTRREGLKVSDERLAQLTEGRSPLTIAPVYIHTRRAFVDEISTVNAIRDTDILFYAMAGAYGPYIYFGGDEVFMPIRDDIIEILNAQPSWSQSDFASLLRSQLSRIIVDGHFIIDNVNLQTNEYKFFTYSGRFYISENGFKCQSRLLYVNELMLPCRPDINLDPDEIFRLSIDEMGSNFFYVPVITLRIYPDETSPGQLVIIYEDGTTETVPLKIPENQWFGGWSPYPTLDFIHNIPVVAIRGLGPMQGDGAQQFLAYARRLSEESVVILDLRGNMGGDGGVINKWFYSLTGVNISPVYRRLTLRSLDAYLMQLSPWYDPYLPFPGGQRIPFDYKHVITPAAPDEIAPNDNLLIVLTDRFSASGAEWMTDITFNMENALVIGQNTNGTMLSVPYFMHLFYSGINVAFGLCILVHPEGLFQEGIGFAPDIWVTGCALTAALGMLENHFHQE
ncbi:MAG: S41 family peptidase [Defluviitaleaceae bacterium]|nr:S41 family peptidase [Defluviitaleaceae bacterium]